LKLRTIVVDDEELARRGICALLEQVQDVEILKACHNGRDAIEAIRTLGPDLVYLDIQMPGQTGFDVIDAVKGWCRAHIVFVTAFDQFAVRAFETDALDYLLKPLNEQRLNTSLVRAREAMRKPREEATIRGFAQGAADVRQCLTHPLVGPLPDRISVRTRAGLVIVRVSDIDWVESDRDYVSLHVGTKTWLLRETITAVDARLAHAGFLRIHRSILVNANRVRELHPLSKGEYTVILINGTELKLSRSYRGALARLLGERI
jgi:two-component system LytT family response regulator